MTKIVFSPLKIEFCGCDKVITDCIEDHIIGFVHKLLGDNNQWHDNFSEYNVSDIYGYKVVKDGICFPDGGYFYVTSTDNNFLNTLVVNLCKMQEELTLCGMKLKKFSFADGVELCKDYDIIHVSRLLLKSHDEYKTYKDADFIDILTEQSKKKLLKMGYEEKDVKNFNITPFHFENAKLRVSKRKNFSHPTSDVMLVVRGKEDCRSSLYSIGLGNSTGYCFGTVELPRNNKAYNINF